MKKFLLAILCVWVSAALANAQTYSRIKQHVREYDSLIRRVEPYLPTNYVAYAGALLPFSTHAADTNNPHSVTADQVGALSAPAGSPLPEAFLKYDAGLSNLVYAYGPRTALWASEAASLHSATGLPETIYPGQLVYQNLVADGSRHVYVCTNAFAPADYPYGDLSWLPAGANDSYWRIFVPQGPKGQTGATGNSTVGLNGLGNVQYGRWDDNTGYVYSTATPVVVSYGGRWYDCLASSTGAVPTTATNFWAISVDKGTSGTIVGWTNLVFRGDWDSGVSDYAENDAVWYYGNLFAVGPTNAAPGPAQAPSFGAGLVGTDSAWWHPLVLRGEKGVKGDDGDLINAYSVYTLLPGTNTLFATPPYPSATRSMLRWVSTVGDQSTYEWVEHPRSGTNVISATNGDLRVNGVSPVETLADRLASGYRTIRPAAVAGTQVSVWPESNFMWRLDTAVDAVTTWAIDVSGRATNEVGILGLETFRAESNSWTWMSGLTNAPPAVGETNLFLLFLPEGSTNWMLY